MFSAGDAWLYARKSSYHGRLRDRGRSVSEQLDEEREWCEENDVPIAGEFIDDDRSASPLAEAPREAFEAMIAAIKSGQIKRGDVVVAWEASRLHRDLEVYVKLRRACWDAGVFWCINGDLYDLSKRADRKRSAYDAVDAEDQAYEISERVRRALRSNARKGRPHGPPLYGYVRRYDSRNGELVDIGVDQGQAAVVGELFNRVHAHEYFQRIMRTLNARFIQSPSQSCCSVQIGRELARLRAAAGVLPKAAADVVGWSQERLERVEAGRWGIRLDDLVELCELFSADDTTKAELSAVWQATPQWTRNKQILAIVRNPAYIGRRYHNGKDVGAAIWPAIVDEATFHAVQRILADPRRRSSRGNSLSHLLSGLGECRVCSDLSRPAKHRSGAYFVYRCQPGGHFSVPADAVERYVVAQLVLRFARQDAPQLFSVAGDHEAGIRQLRADIESWEASLADAESAVAEQQMTVARLSKLEALIQPKIDEAQRKIGQLTVNPLLEGLIKADAEAVYAEWKQLSLEQKRAVIRSELKIVISPVGKGRRNVPVEEYVTLSWRRAGISPI